MPTILFNPFNGLDQTGQLTMNITNRVEGSHETSNSKWLT